MRPPTGPVGLGGRLRRWWRGRDRRALARGLPALLAAAGVAAAAGAVLNTPPRELQARYLTAGKAAFQAKDYPRALTCYERAAGPGGDPDATYRLALAADAAGDPGRAGGLMRGLAPADAPGYAPAHYWVARRLLAASANPRAVAEAKDHLVKALDGDLGPDRPAAHGLLGKLYLADARTRDEAGFHLQKAVAAVPLARLDLARFHLLKGNPDAARQEAAVAARYFRDRAKAEPGNAPAHLAWADALTFADDFPAAAGVLEERVAATAEPVYRAALGKLYAGWHDARARAAAPPTELLTLLDKGLAHDPTSPDLLNRLLGHLRVGGPGADAARAGLHELLARGGTNLAPVHVALAVDARARADAAAERVHLEQAFRLDPRAGTVANNLAWVLLHQADPDPARALALADVAVGREPDNPNYRDTRGRAYLALGRLPDALADLGAAHARAPDTPGLREALAEVYEKLGQPGVAAAYRAPGPKR